VPESKHRVPIAGEAEIVGSLGGSWKISRNGTVLWRSPGRSFAMISRHRNVVTAQDPAGKSVAFDVLSGSSRRLPAGCFVTDRKGEAWILVCDRPTQRRSTIELLTGDGQSRLLSEDRS
jgi:hypothetical protein